MEINVIKEELKRQFNDFFELREKRPNIYQIIAPIYHVDGDMLDIFIDNIAKDNGKIRFSDFGMTLMRLSYVYDVDTPNKEKILNKILEEGFVQNENGKLYIDADKDNVYPVLMQFAQTISKITNMRLFRREVIHSLFFEMLDEFIMTKLQKYKPQPRYFPIPEHNEYEVDYCFNGRPRPIFLFGVNNYRSANLSTICCQRFINDKLKFTSLVVLEDLDVIGKKDQSRLMSAADKQFPSLDEFKVHSEEYLEREAFP
jgi:hypothetical protein